MKLSKEKEYLVLENRRLVHYLILKLGVVPNSEEYNDLESIGYIGLIKAAITYDESKKIKFATYAARCINNEIFMHFRTQNKHANEILIDDVIANDKEGNELTLVQTIEDPDSNFDEKIINDDAFIRIVSIILNCLEKRDRLIMLYRIGGMTQPEIAKKLKLSQSYISRIKNKGITQIRNILQTIIQYREVFSVSMSKEMYKITFACKDIRKFNQIFATLLQNVTSAENLPDFKVVCNSERIVIQVSAHSESFAFIAQIIQEIDNYSLTYESDKNELFLGDVGSTENKPDESKEAMDTNKSTSYVKKGETIPAVADSALTSDAETSKKTVIVEKKPIISDNLSSSIEVDKDSTTNFNSTVKRGSQLKMVRDYMLSKETFTVKELKQQFPDVTIATINNALVSAKNKGLIISVGKGSYETKKLKT